MKIPLERIQSEWLQIVQICETWETGLDFIYGYQTFLLFPAFHFSFLQEEKQLTFWRHLGSFVSFTNNTFPMWVSSAIACLVQIATSFSSLAVSFFIGAEEEWLLAEKLASKLAINKWLLRYLFQEPWVPMTQNLVEIWKSWEISLLALHTV